MSFVGPRRVPKPEAALFDVDGTLIDSMGHFFPVWNVVGPEFGFGEVTECEFYGYAGMPVPDIVRVLHRKHLGSEATDDFVERFIARKKQVLERKAAPRAIDCVVDLARRYAARGVPVVAATSGLRDHVEAHIKANGLDDLFPSHRIICAADVPRGKPHPDIFQRAAALVHADPSNCIAYEDAEAGFEAAYRAGCQVCDVRDLDGYPASPALKRAIAHHRANRTFLNEPPPSS